MPQYDEYQAADEYQQIALSPEAQEDYDALGLPNHAPSLFYKALAIQLDRLPLLELEPEGKSSGEVAA